METNAWYTAIRGNEFDYLALMGALGGYRRPRDKVTALIRRGEIIRVKKGLYVLGPGLRTGAVSREILANLMYGPSYVSLEYALSLHQLIPERVETVTSVTLKKTKAFDTPLGRFAYRNVKKHYYRCGQSLRTLQDGRGYLLACPEKAIADKVYFSSGLHTVDDMRTWLFSDLRIDPEEFIRLNRYLFTEFADLESKHCLRLLAKLAKEQV